MDFSERHIWEQRFLCRRATELQANIEVTMAVSCKHINFLADVSVGTSLPVLAPRSPPPPVPRAAFQNGAINVILIN